MKGNRQNNKQINVQHIDGEIKIYNWSGREHADEDAADGRFILVEQGDRAIRVGYLKRVEKSDPLSMRESKLAKLVAEAIEQAPERKALDVAEQVIDQHVLHYIFQS